MTTDPAHDFVTDYIDRIYPLLCVHCGSENVLYSEHNHDYLCEDCGKWQLKEEEE